jgi:hypothetical protein
LDSVGNAGLPAFAGFYGFAVIDQAGEDWGFFLLYLVSIIMGVSIHGISSLMPN